MGKRYNISRGGSTPGWLDMYSSNGRLVQTVRWEKEDDDPIVDDLVTETWTPLRTLIDEPLLGDLSLRSNGANDYILLGYTFPAFQDTDTLEFEVTGLDLWPIATSDTTQGSIFGSIRNTAPIQRLLYIVRLVDAFAAYLNANNVGTITLTGANVTLPITLIKFDFNKTSAGKCTLFVNGIQYAQVTNNALSLYIAVQDIALFASNKTGTSATLPYQPSVIDLKEAKLTINNTVVVWLRADPAGYFVDTVRGVTKYNRGAVNNANPLTLVNTTTWATGWTNNGNKFIFDTGTLKIAGAGTYNTTFFQHNNYSSLDRVQCSAIVKFNDLASIFGIYRKDPYGVAGGTFAKVDLNAGNLILCKAWDGTSAVVDRYSQAITQTINSNDTYTITLKKNDGKTWLIFKNNATSETDTLYNDGIYSDLNDFVGLNWGKFGIAHLGGNIEITDLKIETDFPNTPKYAIYGDSFVEGNSLVGYGDNYNSRYVVKLRNHYRGNVLISGRGGANAAILLDSLTEDLDKFSPENVIVDVGINDTVFATWQTGINAIIVKILAKEAVPIICTLTPRADRQVFLNDANAYILTTLAASYQILDFAQLLTVGGDRLTQDPALFFPANVHPNVAGHLAIYNYCLTQLI